ncbi:ferritin family protein [Candidatus Woesearchaeota archaeon]|nr:ferritin family protein [Candidatus Woesearchaeota archaeon]
MKPEEAFKAALDLEKKGLEIYKAAAKDAKNQVLSGTFRYLASQEMLHIKAIRRYMEKKEGLSPDKIGGEGLEEAQRFFRKTIKRIGKKAKLSRSDLKAYEAALDLEQSSYDFYKGLHKKTKGSGLKRLFRWLMEQENSHYELVQKAYEFIKNPVAFYTEEERWIAEGG